MVFHSIFIYIYIKESYVLEEAKTLIAEAVFNYEINQPKNRWQYDKNYIQQKIIHVQHNNVKKKLIMFKINYKYVPSLKLIKNHVELLKLKANITFQNF